MKEIFKNKRGYIDEEFASGCAIAVITVAILGFLLLTIFGGLRLDFASGSHRIIPTAVDNDIWGNYKVYFRTTEFTKNQEEDYYYIDKDDKELADEMREYIKQSKTVIVYYDKYVGFKGFTAPGEAPIKKIEVVEE